MNTPSVTTSMRVRFETRLVSRTRRPIVSPTFSPSVAAMRAAAARAARRRGSSRMRRLPFAHGSPRSASGARVVLPAPGGATSTALECSASAVRSADSTSSIGRGRRRTVMRASLRKPRRCDERARTGKPTVASGWVWSRASQPRQPPTLTARQRRLQIRRPSVLQARSMTTLERRLSTAELRSSGANGEHHDAVPRLVARTSGSGPYRRCRGGRTAALPIRADDRHAVADLGHWRGRILRGARRLYDSASHVAAFVREFLGDRPRRNKCAIPRRRPLHSPACPCLGAQSRPD